MRLIDADMLDAEMYHKSFEVDDGRNIWNSGLWIRYKIFEEALRDAPTINASPVRHGKWLSREEGKVYPFWERYTCSVCGKHADDTDYCPNCGARMDADETD